MSKAGKTILIIIIILAVLAAGAFAVFNGVFSKMGKSSDLSYGADSPESAEALEKAEAERKEEMEKLSEEEKQALKDASDPETLSHNGVYENEGIKNILLIGRDTRNEDVAGASSDVIILLSLDDINERIILTSFMRDTYLTLPGEDEPSKLYTAVIKGGPSYLEETLETYFGAKIENYAMVNFTCFEEIVDTLGGIDLKLSDSECFRAGVTYEDLIDAENGIYHVNGRQALKYCRNRSSTPGADYDRTQRQRIVLKTIWNKVREMPVTKQTAVATKALEYVTTDLSRSECLALVAKLPQIKDYEFVSQRIPIDGTSIAYNPDPKFSIVSMEFPPNRAFLLDSLYGIEE